MTAYNQDTLYALRNLTPEWREGGIMLPATQIPITFLPQIRVKYVGNNPTESPNGTIHYNRSDSPQKLEFIIDYKTDEKNPAQAVFIPGHLEGYLLQFTGNLLKLYQELKRLGFEFYFLTEETAILSDIRTRHVLTTHPENLSDLYYFDSETSVSIADSAGLVALVKAGFDDQLFQRIAREIRNPGFYRKIPDLLKSLGPPKLMDALVAVHYDNIDPNSFVRSEIEDRIAEYTLQGHKVYNLSTFREPPPKENVKQIKSPSGKLEDADLGSQMKELIKKLREDGKIKSAEIAGVTWFKCVDGVEYLLNEAGFVARVNYDCTDLVEDFLAAQETGTRIFLRETPISPSAEILRRYTKFK